MKFKTLITSIITSLLIGALIGIGMQLATYLLPSKPRVLKINLDDVENCASNKVAQ